MLRRPKTLPASTTVTDARKSLESESVQILLLVDDTRFHGAVTAIPRDAGPDEPVSRYVDESAPIVTEDTPVSQAVGLLPEKAHGRIVVVDGEDLAGPSA